MQEALKLGRPRASESAVVELDDEAEGTVVSTADADDLIAAVEKAGKTATLADAASATLRRIAPSTARGRRREPREG